MKAIVCPCCGQRFVQEAMTGGEQLARRMRDQSCDCYEAADGGYFLTQGNGRVARVAINDALAKGLIAPKWDDKPHLPYWKPA